MRHSCRHEQTSFDEDIRDIERWITGVASFLSLICRSMRAVFLFGSTNVSVTRTWGFAENSLGSSG